jgi:hypothetical protein
MNMSMAAMREAHRSLVEEMRPFEVEPPLPYQLRRKSSITFPRKCYERAFKYILDHAGTDARLIHGSYRVGADHAWVAIPGGIVFDGALNCFYAAESYLQHLECVPEKEYSAQEAMRAGMQHRNYGPWHDGSVD